MRCSGSRVLKDRALCIRARRGDRDARDPLLRDSEPLLYWCITNTLGSPPAAGARRSRAGTGPWWQSAVTGAFGPLVGTAAGAIVGLQYVGLVNRREQGREVALGFRGLRDAARRAHDGLRQAMRGGWQRAEFPPMAQVRYDELRSDPWWTELRPLARTLVGVAAADLQERRRKSADGLAAGAVRRTPTRRRPRPPLT